MPFVRTRYDADLSDDGVIASAGQSGEVERPHGTVRCDARGRAVEQCVLAGWIPLMYIETCSMATTLDARSWVIEVGSLGVWCDVGPDAVVVQHFYGRQCAGRFRRRLVVAQNYSAPERFPS
jgi:hypothetical protein